VSDIFGENYYFQILLSSFCWSLRYKPTVAAQKSVFKNLGASVWSEGKLASCQSNHKELSGCLNAN